jgi:nicotinate-nucleotide adenylyltransferase
VDSLSKSIGILGGSFDPIHFGHLRLAQEARDFLNLSEVRFVPAGRPPHRGRAKVSDAHRLAMLKIATQNNPSFRVDARELGKTELTYTIDTLQSLRADLGNDVSLVLFIGADQFLLMHTWKRWEQLTEIAHLLVAMRPSSEPFSPSSLSPEVRAWYQAHQGDDPNTAKQKSAGNVFMLGLTPLAISSTAIRATIAASQSPRYLLPDAVLDYIHTHKLYT